MEIIRKSIVKADSIISDSKGNIECSLGNLIVEGKS